MYEFKITVGGLCAFVPRGYDENRPLRLDILLLEVRGEALKRSSSGYANTERHFPVLSFELKNLIGSNEIQGNASGLWRLETEDVDFFLRNSQGTETPLSGGLTIARGRKLLSEEPDPKYPNPVPEQERDFSWLPEMELALKGAGEVDETLLDVDRSDVLSARIHVGSGEVGTESLTGYNKDYAIAQFAPPEDKKKPYRQALAHWVSIKNKIDDDLDIVVRARRFADGKVTRELVLRPSPAAASGGVAELEVYISNLCCGYYGEDEEANLNIPGADDDFVHLYGLCKQSYDEPLPIPIAVLFRREPAGTGKKSGGGDPIRCTGARFKIVALTS